MISVSYPTLDRNYCLFDEKKVQSVLDKREKALPDIEQSLKTPATEEEVLEDLYILNRMLDEGVNGIDNMYPTLSRYNNTKSPEVQTFLSGIYRKTKVPDAFGPLFSMLIQNSINPPKNCYFDPNEEIGGAILDYLA